MKTYKKVIYIAVMVMSILIIMTALSACGEKWERQKKDIESEYSGGLKRELIIYSATGEEVWRFVCQNCRYDTCQYCDNENCKRKDDTHAEQSNFTGTADCRS